MELPSARRQAAVRAQSWRQAAGAAMALALAAAPLAWPAGALAQATDTLIFALLAVSLNLLVGYAGMISLGHAAYFALGGYTAGLLAKHGGADLAVAVVAGVLAAGAAALAIGWLCIRLTHAYFVMLTLAFGQLVYTVIWKWRELTGGDDGLTGIAPPPWLLDPRPYYALTLAVVAAAVALLYAICRSPFGQALKAIRDNPQRAEAIGIPVRRFQLAAFVLAGLAAGLAGGLYAFHHRGMFPDAARWLTSADLLLMVVLGGPSHFAGPVLGTVVVTVLHFLIPRFTPYWHFLFGLIILTVAWALPQGLMGLVGRKAPGRESP